MTDAPGDDLFADKAKDWDGREMIVRLSEAVGAAVLEHIAFTPQMTVMDFGAGTGLITAHVAPLVSKVVAVDTSQSMLDQLVAKPALADKVEARCQDILEVPVGQTFDSVVSAMALHHVEDTSGIIGCFFEHLEPGGRLALADLDAEDGSFHPETIEGVFHHGFDREALRAELRAAGFEEVRFVTAHTIEKEDGTYPVFLVTARKP